MRQKPDIWKAVILIVSCVYLFSGCEAFRKKFVRKKKRIDFQEEMVIVPRDYSAHPFPSDVMYKQYFVYWKAWNQELVTALKDGEPYKKVLATVDQAIINLKKMATYLNSEKAGELGVYVKKTQVLKDEIVMARNMPDSRMKLLRYKADRILSAVNRDFDLRHMKGFLKSEREPSVGKEEK